MKHPGVTLATAAGPVRAIAPLVLSASRATDLPAFYTDWFLDRLAAGFCEWRNPFSGKVQFVSFERARAVVFWSKNPAPLLKRLDEVDSFGLRYYFHFTLNDYEREGFEPNVPPLAERIATFRELSRRVGAENLIWRFDPLLRTETLTPDVLLAKLRRIGDAVAPYTRRLVFSFVDVAPYAKVRRRLTRNGVTPLPFSETEMHETAGRIAARCREWGIEAAACAEPVDFSAEGVRRSACIDPERLCALFPDDPEFAALKRDGGQRRFCGCVQSKDIGFYHSCRHGCLYCYA